MNAAAAGSAVRIKILNGNTLREDTESSSGLLNMKSAVRQMATALFLSGLTYMYVFSQGNLKKGEARR
jgi:hypothetical protein